MSLPIAMATRVNHNILHGAIESAIPENPLVQWHNNGGRGGQLPPGAAGEGAQNTGRKSGFYAIC